MKKSLALIKGMDKRQRQKDIKALLEERKCPFCRLTSVQNWEGGSENRIYFECINPFCDFEVCAFPADLEAGNYVDFL